MKKFTIILLALIMTLSIAGCTKDETATPVATTPAGGTQPAPTPTPTNEPEYEGEVFYFRNVLEYNTVYKQNDDGTGLELVLGSENENYWSVDYSAPYVYYTTGIGKLMSYNTETLETKMIIENEEVRTIFATEGYVAYETQWENKLYVVNTETGEVLKLCDAQQELRTAVDDGYVAYYCTEYDQAMTLKVHARLYSLDTKETEEFTVTVQSASYIDIQDGKVFIVEESLGGDSEITLAEYDIATKTVTEKTFAFDATKGVPTVLYAQSDALYAILVGEAADSLYKIAADGTMTLMNTIETTSYMLAVAEENGKILVNVATEKAVTGSVDDESYYVDSYWVLNTETDTFTNITAPGELGAMFRDGDFPIIDSSTARKPITSALASLFFKNYGYAGAEPLCSTTHGAWLNIADRKADIALLAAPTPEEQAYLDEKGVTVEMKLYGGDGLIFIGNEQNPVKNLTTEQLKDIYRGNITNWKELGGPDQSIEVYYRDDQSGSQRLFEKLVWKNDTVPDFNALGYMVIDEMSGIVDECLNNPFAIGYTIMTYADTVYANEGVKIFSIDGFMPSVETIKSKEYPFNTQGYVVIRADEPENSPARRLYNWFGSPLCNLLLNNNGVSPLSD